MNQHDSLVSKYRFQAYASWFSINEIHEIEKYHFSEILRVKENDNEYKYLRKKIIDSYYENPKIYLSSTKCRKQIIGDSLLITKLHKFLEKWGVINNLVESGNYPQKINFPNISRNIYDICTSCGENPAWFTLKNKENMKFLNIKLCHKCFESSNFPQFLFKKDFEIKYNLENDPEWAQDDIRNLLKYIEEVGPNWSKISNKFKKKKTSSECLLKFLSLKLKSTSELFDSHPLNEQLEILQKALQFSENKNLNIERSLPSEINFTEEQISKIKAKIKTKSLKLEKRSQKQINYFGKSLLTIGIKSLNIKNMQLNDIENILKYEKEQSQSLRGQLFAESLTLAIMKANLINERKKSNETKLNSEIKNDELK